MSQRFRFKRLFILISGAGFFLLAFLIAQYKIIEVSANTIILPVAVVENSLGFGMVFPGEEHEGTFTIQYVEDPEQENIAYQIILKRKPLLSDHPEYPNGGDPDMPGYYKNLCPSLTATSVEEQGDTGSVGIGDNSDVWTIYFKVPAILGSVAQSHEGEIITSNGEYGCDISINVL